MSDDFIPTDEAATRREDGLIGWDDHGPAFAAPEPEVVSRLLMAADGAPWWPRAGRGQLAPVDGGSILDGYGAKGLWHTTETSGWPSYSTGSFPHMTVGLVDGRFSARQHIPFNRAARALRNESGGVQTNRTGVKQVEIIARADVVDEIGLPAALEDGLADWATWLKAEWGVPLTCGVTFKEYPASYGEANGVRLSGVAWERYAGWLGHQHVPENCVTPDTSILCADLTWRPAGDLRVGDKIVAFDEEGDGVQWHVAGSGRRFRTATILRNDPARKFCAAVVTPKATVVASLDHPWLVRRPVGSRGRARFAWVPTRELRQGDLLAWFGEPWGTEATWEAGWLAGMFDADGWLSMNGGAGGAYLGIGQRDGPTQERVVAAFEQRGFRPTTVRRQDHAGWNKQPFAQISVWGMREQMRCLGTIRPPRLMDKELSVLWEGRQVRNQVSIDPVEVWQVEPMGEVEIASITTSTGTFITGGFLSHNTHGDPGKLDWRRILRAEEDTLTPEDKTWIEAKLDQYARESARWTDHGDNTVTGATNHLARVRDDLRLFQEAVGKRLDTVESDIERLIEGLLTPEVPS